MLVGLLVTLALALAHTGCSRVEGTGRRQLMLLSPEVENREGLTAYRQILTQNQAAINRDPAINAMVQRVGQRLAAAAPDRGFQYEFTVIDSPEVNAFCLPGGKVAIYTGILPVCQTEAGLAAVMGHEIAHAIARHGGERVSQGQLVTGLANAGGMASRSNSSSVLAQAAMLTFVLPFSRKHELEADYLGMIYMAKAGYDPREAANIWTRMSQLKGSDGSQLSFISTHPADSKRIRELDKKVGEALELYTANSTRYGPGELIPSKYLSAQQQPAPRSSTTKNAPKRPAQ